eukprot:8169145-Prorocentrum_lima.AAC.1
MYFKKRVAHVRVVVIADGAYKLAVNLLVHCILVDAVTYWILCQRSSTLLLVLHLQLNYAINLKRHNQ